MTRDAAGAVLVMGVGLFACLHAYSNYSIGAMSSPGPGLFPVLIGALMVVSGALVGVQALLATAREKGVPFEARPLGFILLAIAIFALLVETTGYGIAVPILVFVASFADRGMSLKLRAILALSLTVICITMFKLILQVSLPVFFRVW
ncbi:tripartite tricarboxylate transporter TctB family protein [Oceanicola sp. 22II-s10i]|uniref:tripartite tricarboxylate transporter TctB family protein n=1 Tax=Oceanicola sp. 22II-s10i TaxID=1317116 RepID=UPI0015953AE1|nr:tripartite tricarboxylate transporter TctB family protein [Oceanicola sp. 22II-s10i]